MRTPYHIDRYQQTYFVIDDFAELFAATRPDFTPIYREIEMLAEIPPGELVAGEATHPIAVRQKRRAARKHGPSLGRKRLEDVRQNRQVRDPCRTAQFRD
jgi:hypothetical protein